MDLKKKLIWENIIALIVGVVLIVVGLCYANRFFMPGVGVLVVNGIIYFRQRKIYQNEEKTKEFEIKNNDERNQFLAQRSQSWAFSISIVAKCIIMLALFLLKKDFLADIFGYMMCGEMIVFLVCYLVATKKY